MTTPKRSDTATYSSTQQSGPRETAAAVASTVRDAAGTVAAQLPEAAATTRAAVDEAARRIETGSDEMLTAGATLSLGVAVGLLIAGASRLLVVLALVPAAAMGLTLLDRSGRGIRSTSRRVNGA